MADAVAQQSIGDQAGATGIAPPRLTRAERAIAAVLSACLLGPFGVLAFVEPSPQGLGTHATLGLPPCSWPTALGIPCPSCGYTTAATHMAHGHVVASVATQPAGALVAAGAISAGVVAAAAAASGQPLQRLFAPLASRRTVWVAAAAVLLAWGFKIGTFRGWW